MNILYIITGLGLGGAETVAVNLANKFSKKENCVTILYLTGKNMFEGKISDNIATIKLDLQNNFFDFIKGLLRARKIISKINPDIVHAHMVHANVFARILRLIIKFPKLICTAHNINEGGRIRENAYRYTDFLSDINTNVSRQAVDHYIIKKIFSKSKSMCVYNGIDTNIFKPDNHIRNLIRAKINICDDDFLFINVGRLTDAKDQSNLLKAFEIVNKNNPSTKLIIIGDGEKRNNLQKKITDLGLEKSAILLGVKQNVVDYYNTSDVFVSSSQWEGFPLVIIEAMSCGLPVISTKSGGFDKKISEECLVPINDSLKLAQKMQWMLEKTKNEREFIGKQNRNLVLENFSERKIIDQWKAIYTSKT